MTAIDQRRIEIHTQLRNNLEYFATNCLKIKTKGGKLEPFTFNKAQRYLHKALEAQLLEIGKVRAVIIKGRQQGCSTYVAARFYHKAIWTPFQSVYILSHESNSTANLKTMVDTYYENSPSQVQPKTLTDNFRMTEYENKSVYRTGTAGAETTGRSQTHQLLHGSEVAYYTHTDGIETGVMQTVSDEPGTEIILESTANGIGNFFHKKTLQALDPFSEWIVVFIPWFWQEEYQKEPHPTWSPTDEELKLQALYGLTLPQLFWRYQKILSFGGDEWKFKQEYPCTVDEAFQTTGERLISPESVYEARKATITDLNAATVIGVDAARDGDRTVFVVRRGREILKIYKYENMDEMRLCGIIIDLITKHQADKVFVDMAYAAGAIDRLKELGHGRKVIGVYFGESAVDKKMYLNKRAEMASDLKKWFEEGSVSIPDDQDFITDILSIPDFVPNSSGVFKLIDKAKIKKDLGRSPDIFDAAILTFAFPVRSPIVEHARVNYARQNQMNSSQTTTKKRLRAIFGVKK